jgi:hypothetical protein
VRSIGIASLLLAAAPATAAPVPAPDETAIRAFLGRLYQTYQNNDPRKNWHRVMGEANVFAPSTVKLLAENTRLLRGEEGAIGADIFCACQDYDSSLRLASVSLKPLSAQRINAAVVIKNYGQKTLNIQFEKTVAGWRVYDVELPQQGMLRVR